MPTVRMPLGIRKNQIYFEFADYIYDKLFNPKYRIERWTIILLFIDLTFFLLLFPYQTMTTLLLSASLFLIYEMLKTLNNDGHMLIYEKTSNGWILVKTIFK